MNNKTGLILLSLIAAIPGAFLCYLLVAAMLSKFGLMTGMMRALVCLILAFGAVVAAMPIGIVLFGPKDETEEEAEPAEAVEEGAEIEPVHAAETAAVEEMEEVEEAEEPFEAMEEAAEPAAALAEPQDDTSESVVLETDDLFDEFEEPEEEAPQEQPGKKKE